MASTIIVALPAVDEKVYRISSEEVPHLTLMYLGEAELDLEETVLYTQHAAKLLDPFGLTVDYRGTLGADEADVLFFEKDNMWDMEGLKRFRHHLLLNDAIKRSYDSVEQFPEWVPHLTLGYPESPAHKDDDEHPGVRWVQFDRVAVWNGDYKGPEFRLKYERTATEVAMSSTADDGVEFSEEFLEALSHYGVKGMRWGVTRKDRAANLRDVSALNRRIADGTATKGDKARQVGLGAGAIGLNKKVANRIANKTEQRAEKIEGKITAKADKKYDAELRGVKGFVKVNNAIASKINPRLDELNSKPAYKDVDLSKPENAALQKKYINEYRSTLQTTLDEVAADIGMNPSGTKRFALEMIGEGYQSSWEARFEEVKHGDVTEGLKVVPKFDKTGHIVGQEIGPLDEQLEHFGDYNAALAHYGVKGMRWGVTRNPDGTTTVNQTKVKKSLRSTDKPVTVTQRKAGTYVKAKGGNRQTATTDAVKAQAARQKAKRSTTDSLSTKELKDTIERMRLEQEFAKLDKKVSRRGKSFVTALFGTKEDWAALATQSVVAKAKK